MNGVHDKNIIIENKKADDKFIWYNVLEAPIKVYGFVGSSKDFLSRRVPLDIAKDISKSVYNIGGNPAGGRVRFSTNAKDIAFRVEYGTGCDGAKFSTLFSYGFDIYENKEDGREVFLNIICPETGCMGNKTFETVLNNLSDGTKMRNYTVNMPIFSEIKRMYIGVSQDCNIGEGKPYINEGKPVVYYGSSITQGSICSRPGNTYEAVISQKYNLDHYNLGFGGSALGEPNMAKFIADMDMIAFVMDYDHNAPSAEHLENTHYNFYKIIRDKQPNLPIIMVTRPDYFTDFRKEPDDVTRGVIEGNYNRAIADGDENVYYIDGRTLFGNDHPENCVIDINHPTDLGFYRMAEVIGDKLAYILKLN